MGMSRISLILLPLLLMLHTARGGDPDILTDFQLPLGGGASGDSFTYTGLRSFIGANPQNFTVFKATMAELPALNGQSVSYAALYYPPGTVNPPHTHPRASELLFLVLGSLEVGFVNTSNYLFTQTLQAGDIFVFPKGLLHYQYNAAGNKAPAIALSAFGSASAGTVSIPAAVFNTSINDPILAASFKTDDGTIEKLKAGLSH
ncbi:germin-like protein 9-3 [Salvia miltiorrhiza]|uniref:germin-like protein 9-3 n=1 Tax=Salvia miltiorrhiza TaxID=226208 RepID=UPI0025AC5035|nr:germin-like protein 9-3 [Salvia miltiorrhiza]